MSIIGKHRLLHWMFWTHGLAVTVLMGSVVFDNTAGPRPERLRGEAEKLIRKAQDLKAQGAAEEANKLANEAEKLQYQAAKFEKEHAQPRERGDAVSHEKQEKLERLRAEVKELAAAGKMEQAARLKEEILQMEKPRDRATGPDKLNEARERLERMGHEIAALREKGHPEEAERLEAQARRMKEQITAAEKRAKAGPDRPKFPDPERARAQERRPGQRSPEQPAPEDVERRMHHVRVAIENLHAAGLHEPAQRLAEEAEKFHSRLREHRPSAPDAPQRRGDGIQALQGEIRELRQAVQQLRQQLEEIRQRR